VQHHLETFLALCHHDREDERIAPSAERELRAYLQCGIPAYGFARARCGECGQDFLVAFSGKGRAVCPSCTSRRMAETAAHLVDHVLPPLPVRQWVLSLPKRPRYHLHHDRKALNAALRTAVTALAPEAVTAQSSPVQACGEAPDEAPHRSPARYLWAMLLARIYEAFPLTCPQCGAQMRIAAFITDTSPSGSLTRRSERRDLCA